MISHDPEPMLRKTARTLAEIAHTLDSTDDSDARVRRVLELLRQIVPYDRCALLTAPVGGQNEVHVVPDAGPAERAELLRSLLALVHVLSDGAHEPPTPDLSEGLALPVMALDTVVGVLRVYRGDVRVTRAGSESYEVEHVSLLSVVAAQLGAYLTTVRLRREDVKRTLEIEAARDFLQLLTGIVSHDLRNPLAVIATGAALLRTRSFDARESRTLRRIVSASQAAARIVDDLLDVTRARTTGVLPIARQEVDLRALLEEALEDLRLAYPGRDVRFAMSPEGPVRGEWDPDRLSQVVLNLLRNAVEYGPEDRAIVLGCEARAAEVAISVHNEGPAIPRELLPFVFDPFKRGKQRARIGAGLGLGLYIVAQIVEAHGGRVEADSESGRGTTFRITLPRHPVARGSSVGPRSTP